MNTVTPVTRPVRCLAESSAVPSMTYSTPNTDGNKYQDYDKPANSHLNLPAAPQPEQGAGAGRGTVTVRGGPAL